MGLVSTIGSAFILGLLTPLTAVCVLPLYPGFLAFLSNQFSSKSGKADGKSLVKFGLIVVSGVVLFMLLIGLLFTSVLQVSLTNVIGIVSPISFGILGVISLFLIFDVDFSRFLPKFNAPVTKNTMWIAFIFGFFFVVIVIPCNPAFIAAFFARSLVIESFFSSMLGFLSFGFGLGAPLLLFSLVSAQWSQSVIGYLTEHKTFINRTAGIIMLGISIYYLFFVFKIFG